LLAFLFRAPIVKNYFVTTSVAVFWKTVHLITINGDSGKKIIKKQNKKY
jgi:hypothetical protein